MRRFARLRQRNGRRSLGRMCVPMRLQHRRGRWQTSKTPDAPDEAVMEAASRVCRVDEAAKAAQRLGMTSHETRQAQVPSAMAATERASPGVSAGEAARRAADL